MTECGEDVRHKLLGKAVSSSHQAPSIFGSCTIPVPLPGTCAWPFRKTGFRKLCVRSSSIRDICLYSSVSLNNRRCCVQSKCVLFPVFSQVVEFDSPSMVMPIVLRMANCLLQMLHQETSMAFPCSTHTVTWFRP